MGSFMAKENINSLLIHRNMKGSGTKMKLKDKVLKRLTMDKSKSVGSLIEDKSMAKVLKSGAMQMGYMYIEETC